ncbi:MAG TPA: TetR family transcriptional regulator [Nocardioidaceae bacterium]|nr:TetR family transcriptional regulator [Nocardioidaceae bacterium]
MTAEPIRPNAVRQGARSAVRDRLLDAAAEVFAQDGWRHLTMGKVADRAGVSRQTVYNEFGTKPNLAEDLVFRELESFLDLVRDRIESGRTPVEAIGSAVEGALSLAEVNPLLRAVLESAHVGDSELLPFITQSDKLVDRARNEVGDAISTRFPDLPLSSDQLLIAADAIVRIVLSHVTHPTRLPAEVGLELAWLVSAILKGVDGGN